MGAVLEIFQTALTPLVFAKYVAIFNFKIIMIVYYIYAPSRCPIVFYIALGWPWTRHPMVELKFILEYLWDKLFLSIRCERLLERVLAELWQETRLWGGAKRANLLPEFISKGRNETTWLQWNYMIWSTKTSNILFYFIFKDNLSVYFLVIFNTKIIESIKIIVTPIIVVTIVTWF